MHWPPVRGGADKSLHGVGMAVSTGGYHGQVLLIAQHFDGEAVVAAGGLLTDVECLMLSKVLTWLGHSGGSRQEGSGAVGRILCFPGSPRPLPQDTLAQCPARLPRHNCCAFPNCFGKG